MEWAPGERAAATQSSSGNAFGTQSARPDRGFPLTAELQSCRAHADRRDAIPPHAGLRRLPQVLAGVPTMRRQVLLAELQRPVLERRRKRVVPPVEEAEHGHHADDYHHLLVAPLLAQLHEPPLR